MMHERLIRPSNPCCIPRLKRTIATFGDGYSTAVRQSKDGEYEPSAYQLDIDGNFTHTEPWNENAEKRLISSVKKQCHSDLQNSHSRDEPEILLMGDVDTTWVPGASGRIITVTKNHEDPCTDDTDPTDDIRTTCGG